MVIQEFVTFYGNEGAVIFLVALLRQIGLRNMNGKI
jgi:hypothetical protein